MAKNNKYFKSHINLAVQLSSVKSIYSALIKRSEICMNSLEIELCLQPTIISIEYTVRIVIKGSEAPKVYIISPVIYDEKLDNLCQRFF
jgi:hypothetical protein